MNLARFGLCRNSKGDVVPDGSTEEVVAVEIGPEGKRKKYKRRRKNTSKRFIAEMKKKFNLLDLEKPIWNFDRRELLENFAKPSKEELLLKYGNNFENKRPLEDYEGPMIDKNKFAANILWQCYKMIESGNAPFFCEKACSLRTFHYCVKALTTANKDIFNDSPDIYGNVTRRCRAMVTAGLISYKDINVV